MAVELLPKLLPKVYGTVGRPLFSFLYPDIRQLITDLGGNGIVAALYDFRAGPSGSGSLSVVENWPDARGVGGAPSLLATGTARPTLGPSGIAFDGVANYLRNAVQGRLAEVNGQFGMAVVGTWQAADGFLTSLFASTGGGNRLVDIRRIAANFSASTQAGAATTPIVAGIRVLHARVTGALSGAKDGNTAEATSAAANALSTALQLTVGAQQTIPPTVFANTTIRAILIYNGDYNAKQAIVNSWAVAAHGASL